MAHWKQFQNINLMTFIKTVLVTNSLFKNGYETKQKRKNILQFIKILAVHFILKIVIYKELSDLQEKN